MYLANQAPIIFQFKYSLNGFKYGLLRHLAFNEAGIGSFHCIGGYFKTKIQRFKRLHKLLREYFV